MSVRFGTRQLICTSCGKVIEVETGIKTMYCCAQLMVEPEDAQVEENPNSQITARPGINRFECSNCGAMRELEAGIKTIYCCGQLMERMEGAETKPGNSFRVIREE